MNNTKMLPQTNPKVYYDMVNFLKNIYKIHPNLPKTFRVIFFEQKIYIFITDILEKITYINFGKNIINSQDLEILFLKMKTNIEQIKSFLSISLELNLLKLGFYHNKIKELESIAMQLTGWKIYLNDKKTQNK